MELFLQKNPFQEDNLRCLQTLMQRNEYRAVFDMVDGVSFIVDLLRHRNNFQIQYQLIFCVWLLTFNKDIASKEVMTYVFLVIMTYKSRIAPINEQQTLLNNPFFFCS